MVQARFQWGGVTCNSSDQRLLVHWFTMFKVSFVAQMVKNLPAVQKTWFQSLGQEESLEKEMATHSRILAWRIPWTEEPSRLQSMVSQRVGHD